MSNPDEHTFEQALGDLLELPEVQREAALEHIGEKDAALRARLASVIALSKSRAGELLTPPDAGIAPPIGDLEQDPLIGASFDGFTLVSLVGAGGSGRVYEARQTSPDRRVALKVLQGSLVSTAQVRRFREEAQVLAGLQHPGICGLIASGSAVFRGQSLPYLVMEFVEGVPLTQAALTLSLDDKLRLMLALCDAVEYAHRKGIIHRDLKPANVLVEQQAGTPPRTRVVDFGLAKLVAEGQHTLTRDAHALIGTIQYMSPERLVNDTAQPAVPDTRWDVYAIGVMLFEVLAGRRPFDGAGDSASIAAMLRASENPSLSSALPGVHNDLALIADKAMARDINQRYASVAALADDMRAHLARRPISAHPPTAVYRLRKFIAREPGLSLGVLLATAALCVGAIALLIGLSKAVDARNNARAALDVSRVNQYIASVQSAAAHLRADDSVLAKKMLDAAPEEFRGFEWRLLASGLEQSTGTIELREPRVESGGLMMAGSPDGRWLACEDDRTIFLIDTETHEMCSVAPEFGVGRTLWWLAWSPDGSRLYATANGTTSVLAEIDTHSLQTLRTLTLEPNSWGAYVAPDPSGRTIVIHAVCEREGTYWRYIQVRDANTWDLLYEEPKWRNDYSLLPTALDATLLEVTSDDRVQLFNWRTGVVTPLPIPTDGGGQGRNGVAISPDGTLFAIASMRGTQVWSFEPLRQVIGFGATLGTSWHRLAFSHDGTRLYATQNARLVGWDIRTGEVVASSRFLGPDHFSSIALDATGKYVFLAHQGSSIRVASAQHISGPTHIRAREGSALSPDFSTLAKLSLPPDNDGIVTASLVDPVTGETKRELDIAPPGHAATHLEWSPDGNVVLADNSDPRVVEDPGYVRGGFCMIDLRTGTRTCVNSGRRFHVRHTRFAPDSTRIAYNESPGRWVVASLPGLEPIASFNESHEGSAIPLAWSPDGEIIVLGFFTIATIDHEVHCIGLSIRRAADGSLVRELAIDAAAGWFHCAFSPDGKWLALRRNIVELVDCETWEVVDSIPIEGPVPGIAWHPDSSRLYVGAYDATLRVLGIFNLRRPGEAKATPRLTELLVLRGDSWLTRPQVSTDGTRVGCVTVYPANRCFIWDARPTYQPARARPSLHH
ncbi:MAG: WD40 repeat domain-containing serine/threonine protein kinase [Phycisphaerales bacterium]